MRIFIYEFVTGGGLLTGGAQAPILDSLLREGRAMLRAIASDFAGLDSARVHVLRDSRFTDLDLPSCFLHDVATAQEEHRKLIEQSAAADWTLLIAPEFDNCLLSRRRVVQEAGGRPLGPDSRLIELTSDKQATAEHLRRAGLAVPEGRPLAPGETLPADFDYPAVLKPRFGAGSLDVRLVRNNGGKEPYLPSVEQRPARLEQFVRGVAASVSFLCGPGGRFGLTPCRQRISRDGRFRYLGGSLPLEPPLARRATDLASRAVATLDSPLGYIGVDLVLGNAADGTRDVVVEINPRLTTSYVGLRATCRQNLAGAMLVVADGRAPRLSFEPAPLTFDADGEVRNAMPQSIGEPACG